MTTEQQPPTWDQIRDRLVQIGQERGDWAGIPLPTDGLAMVLEPRYPYQGLAERWLPDPAEKLLAEAQEAAADQACDIAEVRNSWYDVKRSATVFVYRSKVTGKFRHAKIPRWNNGRMMSTLQVVAGPAWSAAAEFRAMQKLHDMVGDHKFKCYVLCGMFLETSRKSGVSYLFRKLRPTLALKADLKGQMKILAALCLHPIGYYDGSWCGAMCPTDDVLAHLTLMRGDEHRFWKNSNQHPAWAPEAGI